MSRPVRPPRWLRLLLPLLLLTPAVARAAIPDGTRVPAVQEAPPLLSETIRETLDKEGVDAAKKRFAEIYPDAADRYRFDMEGLSELGMEYMRDGDFERGQAVMEMVAAMARDSFAASLPEGMALPRDESRDEGRETDDERSEGGARSVQPPLPDDVAERYEGVYRDPGETDPTRRFFLARDPCGPQIMFGAMWGDAQNSYLKIESETLLVQPRDWVLPGQEPLRIEVRMGADGRAESLSHDADWFGSPLVRDGELPEAWRGQPCRRG